MYTIFLKVKLYMLRLFFSLLNLLTLGTRLKTVALFKWRKTDLGRIRTSNDSFVWVKYRNNRKT